MYRIFIIIGILILIFTFAGKAQVNCYDSIFKIADRQASINYKEQIKELTEQKDIFKWVNESRNDVFKIQMLTYSGLIDICFSSYISRRKIYNCISKININK
jgi:hypothetical protein